MKEASKPVSRMLKHSVVEIPLGLENVDKLLTTFTELKGELQEMMRAGSQNQSLSARVNQIDSALERLKMGRYGVCSTCFLVMPKNELFRNPFRDECSNCGQRQQSNPP